MVLAWAFVLPDALIEVRTAPGRGLGAFAAEAISSGALVCSYHGERISQREVAERYSSVAGGDYLFELSTAVSNCAKAVDSALRLSTYVGRVRPPSSSLEGLYIDARLSSHASRFINHAEHGNLIPSPAGLAPEGGASSIDFHALRPIEAGEELLFDYGVEYWAARPAGPTPDTDSRVAEIRLRRFVRWLGPWLLAVQRNLPL